MVHLAKGGGKAGATKPGIEEGETKKKVSF